MKKRPQENNSSRVAEKSLKYIKTVRGKRSNSDQLTIEEHYQNRSK